MCSGQDVAAVIKLVARDSMGGQEQRMIRDTTGSNDSAVSNALQIQLRPSGQTTCHVSLNRA